MEFLTVLWSYILTSAPYLIMGLAISGMIHVLVPMKTVKKWLGAKSVGSVAKASLVGVPLPLCSCSVIPTAVTLRKSGASNASTSAFLISTPESGVDSISITYAFMDLPMTIIRPIAAFTSAFVAGVFQLRLNDFELAEEDKDAEEEKSCCSKSEVPKKSFLDILKTSYHYGFGKLSNDIAGWLTIGIILGALIEFIVPDQFFSGLSMIENRGLILLIGIPLYICASASTPIAYSLMLKGLSPGSAILFLLVGPATNVSNIAVMQKYIGKKGVIINIASIIIVALIFSVIVDYFYANYFVLKLKENISGHNHAGHAWWEIGFGLFLIFILLKGIYTEKIHPLLNKEKMKSCH